MTVSRRTFWLLVAAPIIGVTAMAEMNNQCRVPEVIDVGVTPPASRVDFEMRVSNEGDSELIIRKIVAGCTCTIISSFSATMAPFTEQIIKGKLDTPLAWGPFQSRIAVECAGSVSPAHSELRGFVDEQLRSRPHRVRMGSLQRSELPKRTVVSLFRGTMPEMEFQSLDISGEYEFLRVKNLKSETDDAGAKSFEIQFLENAPSGQFEELLLFRTSNRGISKFVSLPVSGEVLGPARFTPDILFLNTSGRGAVHLETPDRSFEVSVKQLTGPKTPLNVTVQIPEVQISIEGEVPQSSAGYLVVLRPNTHEDGVSLPVYFVGNRDR